MNACYYIRNPITNTPIAGDEYCRSVIGVSENVAVIFVDGVRYRSDGALARARARICPTERPVRVASAVTSSRTV